MRPRSSTHCQRIGKQFGLYDNALFHTEVTELEWDEAASAVDHPHRPRRRVHGAVRRAWAPGRSHVPKLPGIPGIETFAGHSFHTSRWDYDYTGGDSSGAPMDEARPTSASAIIGTGATAVQCVPHLAQACHELYVFQRTPSSVDVRNNHADRSASGSPTSRARLAEAVAR